MTSSERLRIGIDFDGTLVDTIDAAARFLRDVDGIILGPDERSWPPGRERVGVERFAEMIVDARFFARLEFVPGAERVTRSLLEHANVFLVTARNEAQTVPVRRWLEARDLHFNGIVATSYESKVEACRALRLDLHFDDMLAHTADLMRETDTVLALLAAPWNDLTPSTSDVSDGEVGKGEVGEGEHRIHDGWHAFHDRARGAFDGRLGPS